MQRLILVLTMLVVLLSGHEHCTEESEILWTECGMQTLTDEETDSSDEKIDCKFSDTRAFLNNLPFTVDDTRTVTLQDSSRCFIPVCRNEELGDLRRKTSGQISPESQPDFNDFTRVGDSLGEWRCTNQDFGMTAHCETFEIDGSGWNLVKAWKNGTLCKSKACQEGSYVAEGVCSACPTGKYTDTAGATQCEDCRRGHFSDIEGATECKPCAQGNYTNEEGARECKMCSEGYHSNEKGATQCEPCPRGSFSDVEGATECNLCPQGSYNGEEGATQCIPCPHGRFSDVEGATECNLCPQGSYNGEKGATQCKPCPHGHFSDVEGATGCEPCSRGRYTTGEGATQCLYCPAGHTTYRYSLNACVGPQLDGLDRSKRIRFQARVSYETLGKEERKAWYWRSVGDWSLVNKYNRKFGKITQKYTTSYRRGARVIRKSPVTTAVTQIIKDVYCYTGNGERYRGYVTKTKSGEECKGPYWTTANRKRVSYCRNSGSNRRHTKPYCRTQSGTEEDCDIPKCNGQESENEVGRCEYTERRINEPTDTTSTSTSIEFPDLDDARRVCDKLGGECTGVWRKGSSWKVTGVSLLEVEMGSGTQTFYVKSPDCVNPYYEHHFEQKWEG